MNETKPTHETDALLESLNEDFDVELASMTAHACRMERERDEARKLAEDMWMFDPQQRKLPWK